MNPLTETARYHGSAKYHADLDRLSEALVDAAQGLNGSVAMDVLDEALRLDGTPMVDDVVHAAKQMIRLDGNDLVHTTLASLVAVAYYTLGIEP